MTRRPALPGVLGVRTPTIESLLPTWASVVETRDDASDELLWPDERALIARATPGRRAEFATVRVCARNALVDLGQEPAAILRARGGAPAWPAGVVGSVTHCPGYRAAAVARLSHARGIGIDAEPHRALPVGVLDAIARPEEHARLAMLATRLPDVHWDRLLFSIKESVYKACYSLTRGWFDVCAASIEIDATSGEFTGRLPSLPERREALAFSGRFGLDDDLILTGLAV